MVRRRRPSSPEVQTPLNDEDLLQEILLCLPPQPSSILRAVAVSKRWRRVVLDAPFLRRFRACHRKPPLLGFFLRGVWNYPLSFVPVMDPPNRIHGARLFGPWGFDDGSKLLGCRHGLSLFLDWSRQVVLLWDPVTSHERRVSFPLPLGYTDYVVRKATTVVCADDEVGHVHGRGIGGADGGAGMINDI
ncbi:uncharacterized protein LOC112272287 [Brachypodium distachyon]|uniref:F-box domain-containing protein n=1 Tax=Brachypodium distachyon TaxID=15368 RepID=A0A2K2CLR0_BRADI|nr:uncharacterized protein LOC112272287 [Brachypodium distachyon]PNT62970.1 hypothetical protein BRADI_4g10077v3 [Brachypodium distachyon]|eukprot:XP_024318443.1 uncharacterized protein LOC112272287 [Brachypodium distachyon]